MIIIISKQEGTLKSISSTVILNLLVLYYPYVRLVKTSPWTSIEGLRTLGQTILGP